jgi:hypothetical protein
MANNNTRSRKRAHDDYNPDVPQPLDAEYTSMRAYIAALHVGKIPLVYALMNFPCITPGILVMKEPELVELLESCVSQNSPELQSAAKFRACSLLRQGQRVEHQQFIKWGEQIESFQKAADRLLLDKVFPVFIRHALVLRVGPADDGKYAKLLRLTALPYPHTPGKMKAEFAITHSRGILLHPPESHDVIFKVPLVPINRNTMLVPCHQFRLTSSEKHGTGVLFEYRYAHIQMLQAYEAAAHLFRLIMARVPFFSVCMGRELMMPKSIVQLIIQYMYKNARRQIGY